MESSNSPEYRDNNFNLQTGMGPLTDNLLNTVLDRVTSGDFRERLADKIVDPITDVINKKIQPYIYLAAGLYILLVILLLVIIYLLVKKNRSQVISIE